MIIDVLLSIPTVLITQLLELLEVAQPYPVGVQQAFIDAGNYVARLDFIFPMYLIGDMLFWWFLMLIAWFFIWSLGVFVFLYQAFKLF